MKYNFSYFHFALQKKKREITMSLFLKLYLLAYSHAQIFKKNLTNNHIWLKNHANLQVKWNKLNSLTSF